MNNLIAAGHGREAAFAAAVLGDNALMEKAWQDTGMLAEAVLHAHVSISRFIGFIGSIRKLFVHLLETLWSAQCAASKYTQKIRTKSAFRHCLFDIAPGMASPVFSFPRKLLTLLIPLFCPGPRSSYFEEPGPSMEQDATEGARTQTVCEN